MLRKRQEAIAKKKRRRTRSRQWCDQDILVGYIFPGSPLAPGGHHQGVSWADPQLADLLRYQGKLRMVMLLKVTHVTRRENGTQWTQQKTWNKRLRGLHAWLYLAVIFQLIFNLMLQTEEAVRSRPAGWRLNIHVQALLHLLAAYNPGTVGLDWTKEKQENNQNCNSTLHTCNEDLTQNPA